MHNAMHKDVLEDSELHYRGRNSHFGMCQFTHLHQEHIQNQTKILFPSSNPNSWTPCVLVGPSGSRTLANWSSYRSIKSHTPSLSNQFRSDLAEFSNQNQKLRWTLTHRTVTPIKKQVSPAPRTTVKQTPPKNISPPDQFFAAALREYEYDQTIQDWTTASLVLIRIELGMETRD